MNTPKETSPAAFIRMARALRLVSETSFQPAARAIARQDRALALDVMETIGSYPSSEPALRALQEVWTR